MRAAYHAFCQSQIAAKVASGRTSSVVCDVSFTALMSNYNVLKATKSHLKKHDNPPPLLKMDGSTCCVVPVKVNGVRNKERVAREAEHFTLQVDNNKVAYIKYKQGEERVLVLNPYFTVNMADERACFAILLLHKPWGNDGEVGLTIHPESHETISAVEAFKYHNENAHFPAYVENALQRVLLPTRPSSPTWTPGSLAHSSLIL